MLMTPRREVQWRLNRSFVNREERLPAWPAERRVKRWTDGSMIEEKEKREKKEEKR